MEPSVHTVKIHLMFDKTLSARKILFRLRRHNNYYCFQVHLSIEAAKIEISSYEVKI